MPGRRMNLSLTFEQIGMIRGALAVTLAGLKGPQAELAVREVNQLIGEIGEQVNEQIGERTSAPATAIRDA